jgi:hypothetical protein
MTMNRARSKPTTVWRSGSTWNSFYRFCLLSGDYESALILNKSLRHGTRFQLRKNNVLVCADFMTNKEDHPLRHPNTRQEVKDVLGKTIPCIARYQSRKSLEGRVAKLHSHFESTTGPCSDGACNDCHRRDERKAASFTSLPAKCGMFCRTSQR